MTAEEVTSDVLSRTTSKGSRYWLLVSALAVMLVMGIVGVIMRLGDDRTHWGYYAATFSFLFTTTQTAPLVSVALRLAKNHWRRPLARASELFAVVGLFNILVLIPLLLVLPSTEGRHTIWIVAHNYSPHVFDTMALTALVICGLGLLWTSAIPDFATARDHNNQPHGLYSRLALGWQGTVAQWKIQRVLLGFFGAFYFMMIIFVHFLISSDFSMGLVPGWVDSIYPTFHALSGLQAALATMLLTMFILRTFGGYRDYLPMESFWGLSKILLATSLLWFYFWWSAFITFWYGRMQIEQDVMQLIMFGPYRYAFVIAFLFCFVFAVVLLIWNPIRKSPAALAAIATMILIGCFFDRIRLYVSSWSVENVTAHELEAIPNTIWPELPDYLIMLGGPAGAVLVYLLASRIFPIISMWEMKELKLYQVPRRLVRRTVLSLGKPE